MHISQFVKKLRLAITYYIRSSPTFADSSTTADCYSVCQPCGKPFVMRSCFSVQVHYKIIFTNKKTYQFFRAMWAVCSNVFLGFLSVVSAKNS
jgi:hypothetical protein